MRSMSTAPIDGTMVRLLVTNEPNFPLNDDSVPFWTMGYCDPHGDIDEAPRWVFVGWCWEHDFMTPVIDDDGVKVIGWLPLAPE